LLDYRCRSKHPRKNQTTMIEFQQDDFRAVRRCVILLMGTDEHHATKSSVHPGSGIELKRDEAEVREPKVPRWGRRGRQDAILIRAT
jgi:hypothetical protein